MLSIRATIHTHFATENINLTLFHPPTSDVNHYINTGSQRNSFLLNKNVFHNQHNIYYKQYYNLELSLQPIFIIKYGLTLRVILEFLSFLFELIIICHFLNSVQWNIAM